MDPVIGIGQEAPSFVLEDVDGRPHSLGGTRGRTIVLNFWSAECPWSKHADPSVAKAAATAGAELWTIACCAGESIEQIRQEAEARGLAPMLIDPDQAVADAYGAQATPHVFVVDREGRLRYQGAPDDTGFGFTPPTTDYLAEALNAIQAGRDPEPALTPARGCAILRRIP